MKIDKRAAGIATLVLCIVILMVGAAIKYPVLTSEVATIITIIIIFEVLWCAAYMLARRS